MSKVLELSQSSHGDIILMNKYVSYEIVGVSAMKVNSGYCYVLKSE